jgi:hypothetical protein
MGESYVIGLAGKWGVERRMVSYDRFEVERDGKSYVFYFLADRVLAAEAALFQLKP